MAPNRIIIDTDPGIDDVLAMLLAFSARPEELEVLMLSITFGNVDVQSCLRNVVTLFQYIEKERAWRKAQGREEGFDTLVKTKPLVAVGADEPLAEHKMVADYFHGKDGLAGIHETHPHFSPADTWKSLFTPPPDSLPAEEAAALQAVKDTHKLFTPSLKPAPEEMLRILRENEPDTITIVAVGPLTNVASAAATDPEAFLRAKEVVVMGGAVKVPGNLSAAPPIAASLSAHIPVPNFNLIKQPDTPLRRALNERNQMTPVAEFNTYADSIAAARVYALTSPNPKTTMPVIPGNKRQLPQYPEALSKRLTVKLFPLDITSPHLLPRALFEAHIAAPSIKSSPLAEWAHLFISSTYRKILSLDPTIKPSTVGLELHDPLCIWYCLAGHEDARWKFTENEDIRVETAGQWTRGACIVDRRGRPLKEGTSDLDREVVGDTGGWSDTRRGNRLERCIATPGTDLFARVLLDRIFGPA